MAPRRWKEVGNSLSDLAHKMEDLKRMERALGVAQDLERRFPLEGFGEQSEVLPTASTSKRTATLPPDAFPTAKRPQTDSAVPPAAATAGSAAPEPVKKKKKSHMKDYSDFFAGVEVPKHLIVRPWFHRGMLHDDRMKESNYRERDRAYVEGSNETAANQFTRTFDIGDFLDLDDPNIDDYHPLAIELEQIGATQQNLRTLSKIELDALVGLECPFDKCRGRLDDQCAHMYFDFKGDYEPALLDEHQVSAILQVKSVAFILSALHPILFCSAVIDFCKRAGYDWSALTHPAAEVADRVEQWDAAVAAFGSGMSRLQRVVLWHRLECWYKSLRAVVKDESA